MALLADGLRLCFFVGVICLAIGLIRNRRYRKDAAASEASADRSHDEGVDKT